MASNVPDIKTSRLLLSNICEKDTDIIVKWRSDPSVFCFFLAPHAISSEEHITWYNKSYLSDNNRIDWMAVDSNGKPVGVFGVRKESGCTKTAEISYILAPEERGKGYANEAIQALLLFVKDEWQCEYAIAEIHEDNVASIRFAINQGMMLASKKDRFLVYQKSLLQEDNVKKKIFIRADGNEKIGTGHIMRCLSIAEQLRKFGAEVCFVTADDSVRNTIISKGFLHINLHSKWDDMEQELISLCNLLVESNADAVVVDSYYVTENYLRNINICSPVFYIDDLHKMTYPVSTLINYNIYAEDMDYRYADYGRLLLGPHYSPLREEFIGLPQRKFSSVDRILITSGGTDEYNVVGNILRVMSQRRDFSNKEYFCVLGRFNKNVNELCERYGKFTNIHLLRNISNMADYMMTCDIAITAGGTTCYELCACGIPSVMYTLADNQYGVANAFSKKGIIPWVGDVRMEMENCVYRICDEVNNLNDRTYWEERSKKMQTVVDGYGAERLAKLIVGD